MAEAAKIAADNGADIIDINMGCPAKKVIGGYSGSALMRDPDHALSLIEATVKAVDVPVTLKMRLGWDENSINAPEIAKRAEEAGVQLITIHGRTRMQFYEGRADWDAIRAVRDVDLGAAGRQWRCRDAGGCAGDPAPLRRRCGHDRPRLPGAAMACRRAGRRSRASGSAARSPTLSSSTTR